MTEMGMENTTQQLHYQRREDQTTQGQVPVPQPPPTELVAGRVPPPPPQPTEPGVDAGPETVLATTPPPRPPQRPSGRGQTAIADEVVERVIQKIVDLAADEVAGVHGLRPGVDGFFGGAAKEGAAKEGAGKATGTGTGSDRAVAVTLADGQATINVSIEVDFGYAVHEVVDQVRSTVIGRAEKMLGLTVAEVNMVVSDVSFEPLEDTASAPSPGAPAADAGEEDTAAGRRAAAGKRPRT